MKNNRKILLEWVEEGALEPSNLPRAIDLSDAQPNSEEWISFLKTTFIWMSVVCFACGVIFFFAYNWQAMGRMAKFGLVQGALLVSVLGYIRFSGNPRIRSASLMGMSLLTGALLALVGQTYQTGADPWQLFAVWSVLILPWALIDGRSPLWLLWIGLVNLSLFLYLYSNSFPVIFGSELSDELVLLSFALPNIFLLVLFELQPRLYSIFFAKNYSKTTNQQTLHHPQRVLALLAAIVITSMGIFTIIENNTHWWPIIFYLGCGGLAVYYYWLQRRDIFILSALSLSLITVVVSFSLEYFTYGSRYGFGIFQMLLVSVEIIGLSSAAGIWLKKLSAEEIKVDLASEVKG